MIAWLVDRLGRARCGCADAVSPAIAALRQSCDDRRSVLRGAQPLPDCPSDRSYHNIIQGTLKAPLSPPWIKPPLRTIACMPSRCWTGIFLVTGIVFIVWFRDAYKNVGRLGVAGLRWSSGWAVGAWLVPFLNLRRPKEMLNDMWRGSNPSLPRGSTVALVLTVPRGCINSGGAFGSSAGSSLALRT